jgi:DNA-binding SARP family transcriptional activator
VIHDDEGYRLNVEAGVGVDVTCFDTAAEEGEQEARAGQQDAAAALFHRAIGWYKGDLSGAEHVLVVIERERLRARYLNLLARLADYYFNRRDYACSLSHALVMLRRDPCREDAHRQVMRCYVRRDERAQAIRQYRLCERILRAEFDGSPEVVTKTLFDQIRLSPESI